MCVEAESDTSSRFFCLSLCFMEMDGGKVAVHLHCRFLISVGQRQREGREEEGEREKRESERLSQKASSPSLGPRWNELGEKNSSHGHYTHTYSLALSGSLLNLSLSPSLCPSISLPAHSQPA